ncbi:MAG: site-specific integrase [Anaerolineales bacterium]
MIAKLADGYSKSTIKMYQCRLNALSNWLQNVEIENIKTRDLREYLLNLRMDFKPDCPGFDDYKLTGAKIHSYLKAIRGRDILASEELEVSNAALAIKAPR